MATESSLNINLCLLVTFVILNSSAFHVNAAFNRSSFPEGFIFGAGSASYQCEGAWRADGKGISIWDTFTKHHSAKIADGSNGDVADDFYHRYKDDIKLMKKAGLDSFRFSISWSRILPRGKISGGINKLGIQFYDNLINELITNGIEPFVTIFHWDVPQILESDYGGFLNSEIVDDFQDYANLVFEKFGDRVKYWATVNEPNIFAQLGYDLGMLAPGRCSSYVGNCAAGDSATEPYLVVHNLLRCHAATVDLYRRKYQAEQEGMIGLSIATFMYLPLTDTIEDQMAAQRSSDFRFGWIINPVVYGDYPESMRSIVGDRLPKFTNKESNLLKQSFDFLGLNYYTTYYAQDYPRVLMNQSYVTDCHAANKIQFKNGVPIGEWTQSWYMYPKGLEDLLTYVKETYNNPVVIITENGMADANNGSLSTNPEGLQDGLRIKYHRRHLAYLHKSIKEGANVIGYMVWTWMDDFEWNSGYTVRYGLIFVDVHNTIRTPKNSYYWFMKFLAKN